MELSTYEVNNFLARMEEAYTKYNAALDAAQVEAGKAFNHTQDVMWRLQSVAFYGSDTISVESLREIHKGLVAKWKEEQDTATTRAYERARNKASKAWYKAEDTIPASVRSLFWERCNKASEEARQQRLLAQ